MLTTDNTLLVIVDVQGKLATLMHDNEALFKNLQALAKGSVLLDIPILWLEQLPEKLGSTIPELQDILSDLTPIEKSSFSGCGAQGFTSALKASGRQKILLAGIEAHICVYQTAADLLLQGYEVEVVVDAVSSRTLQSKDVALDKMSALGADLTTVEMALFELMETAEAPQFREIARLIK
ncbi:hydrolase [Endozoicomonas ascidiicola]|uniref:hydrolase n=1 Tax=Endozoicomonas ascidiicola TaxID=1698521 RepID=UPI00082F1220|nr:hydrolase [Endozoicomonas ascidiicola]